MLDDVAASREQFLHQPDQNDIVVNAEDDAISFGVGDATHSATSGRGWRLHDREEEAQLTNRVGEAVMVNRLDDVHAGAQIMAAVNS